MSLSILQPKFIIKRIRTETIHRNVDTVQYKRSIQWSNFGSIRYLKTYGALAELIIYTCMHKGEGDNMASDDGQTVINLGSEKKTNNEL